MELKKCLLTKNDCYKKSQIITPKGIVVHSTGANNPTLKRYVQPDDGILGNNPNNNHWNRSGLDKCVHAFIGKDKNGKVRVYQTLPFDYACWGVGKGSKGSYNYNPAYIQFEICEDGLTDKSYFEQAFKCAIEFCAYLCKKYNLKVDNIVSHAEAHAKGYGSNHADCDHWLKKFSKDMNWFRGEVKKGLSPTIATPIVNSIPTQTGAVVTWNKISGANGYRVYYKKQLDTKWTLIKKTTALTLTHTLPKNEIGHFSVYACYYYDDGTYAKSGLGESGYVKSYESLK